MHVKCQFFNGLALGNNIRRNTGLKDCCVIRIGGVKDVPERCIAILNHVRSSIVEYIPASAGRLVGKADTIRIYTKLSIDRQTAGIRIECDKGRIHSG